MEDIRAGMGQPVFQGALTKRVLLALPEGMYMMSCVGDARGTPLFMGSIPPIETREELWRDLKARGVAGRTCWGFNSVQEFQFFTQGTPVGNAPPGSPFSGEGNRVH